MVVPGIQVRRSPDLITWPWLGRAFSAVPPEAKAWSNCQGLWAPDIIKLDAAYHLCYAASTFGSQTSCIGHATGASPEGPWKDEGLVVKSERGAGPNAIDPTPVMDTAGNLWMSYDSLSSDYNIRVGRADSIEGPYLVGHKAMGGYSLSTGEGWVAPGHNSVLHDGQDWFLVHHARGRRDKNWMYLHVRRILWSDNGWPMASPERCAGETVQPIDAADVAGRWEMIPHERTAFIDAKSKSAELRADGTMRGDAGAWRMRDAYTIELSFKDSRGQRDVTARFLPGWDWENGQPAFLFTGLDADSTAFWGKRTGE